MKGVVLLGEKQLSLIDFPDPNPGADEVVLEIQASGMCGTDLHTYRGPKRRKEDLYIEGHEPCGVVAEVGAGVMPSQAKVGDRVMVHHYDGCRVCRHCRSGWTQMCTSDDRVVFGGGSGHGAHAKFMKVPAHTLVSLPDALTYKAGAAIS